MINATFTYTDSDSVVISGSFVCQQSITRIIGGAPYTFYLVNTSGRVIIHFQRGDNAFGVIEINEAKYYTDNGGAFDYDATDELRTIAADNSVTFLYLFEANVRITPVAGIDPETALLPAPSMLNNFSGSYSGRQILPPSVILQHPELSALYGEDIELYGSVISDDWQAFAIDGATILPTYGEIGNEFRQISFVAGLKKYILHPDFADKWQITQLNDCDDACVLRWLSETGVYKQAIWRVKKTQKQGEPLELQSIGDNYKQIKSENVEFVAYIEGLDAYSYAYYGDIITSSDVHCAMRAGDTLTSEYTQVAVTTKSLTIPDGDSGALQTLEIKIAYKHYDAI